MTYYIDVTNLTRTRSKGSAHNEQTTERKRIEVNLSIISVCKVLLMEHIGPTQEVSHTN